MCAGKWDGGNCYARSSRTTRSCGTTRTRVQGHQGLQGPTGPGLENNLTHITAISWKHNVENNIPINVLRLDKSTWPGIVIAFSDNVIVLDPTRPKFPPIDADHVFQVLAREKSPSQFNCLCPIIGQVIPVTCTELNGVIDITSVKEVVGPNAQGIAFFPGTNQELVEENFKILNEFWVRLHGDFVLEALTTTDAQGHNIHRAVDVEFIRATLPTGNRVPSILGGPFGLQGGLFESWFWMRTRPANAFNLNTATADELKTLPGIGDALAARIIKARSAAPLQSVDDLLKIQGITNTILDPIRDRITVN